MTMAGIFASWNQPEEPIETLKTGLKASSENDSDLNRILLQFYLHRRQFQRRRAALGPDRTDRAPYRTVSSCAGPQPPGRRPYRCAGPIADSRREDPAGPSQAQEHGLQRHGRDRSGRDSGGTPAPLAHAGGAIRDNPGLFDLAGTAYDELVRLDPASSDYHLQAAAAWRQSGDIERCIKHYETATLGKSRTTSLAAWIGLIEARLDLQFRKNSAEARDWRGVEATLKQARNKFGDGPGIVLLEATLAIARNNRQAALAELQKLADEMKTSTQRSFLGWRPCCRTPAIPEAEGMLDRYRRIRRRRLVLSLPRNPKCSAVGKGDATAGIKRPRTGPRPMSRIGARPVAPPSDRNGDRLRPDSLGPAPSRRIAEGQVG